jgi:poly-gamma-glutamate synthesis protein (capsule biosynthesis protein)
VSSRSEPPASASPIKLALAGDTMLGRGVARELEVRRPETLVADEVVEVVREADMFVLNLECCISERGRRWPGPRKPFFFRAPPAAVETLHHLGVDCVTLANNHALDYGPEALLDTFRWLDSAGIARVGAGEDGEESARAPRVLEAEGFRLAVVGASDHPAEYAAGDGRPGIAFADLKSGELPDWLAAAAAGVKGADAVLVTPHWGPNMRQEPVDHVRAAAGALADAGATLVAGHSAHVFQGVDGRVLYDLGDFIDDYAVDPVLRNDLGLLFLVELDQRGPVRLEAVPLKLDYCHTTLADGDDAAWIRERFEAACAAFGTAVAYESGRLVIE